MDSSLPITSLITVYSFTRSFIRRLSFSGSGILHQVNNKKYMKLHLSAAFVALLFAANLSAQKHVNLGVKAGFNLYTIQNNNGVKYDLNPGFHAGLLGHIHVSKNFAVQPEVFYSAQGARYTAASVTTKLNLGYVNVPLLFQYMFDNGFRLQAGPQVGFLITAKADNSTTKTDVKAFYKPIDVAVAMGLGYIHVPSGWGIDARYHLGVNNINDNSNVKSANRGFQLGVFYQFKHH